MAMFVKLATATGLPSTELVLLRAIFQGAFVILAMFWYTDPRANNKEKLLLIQRPFGSPQVRAFVIARGVIGGLGFIFYYYTYAVLPLGDATTLLSLNPVITVLGASIFLKDEPIRRSHLFAVAASVVGSMLLARPSFLFGTDENDESSSHSSPRAHGYLTGVLGACSGAAVYILIRRAGQEGVHTLQLLFSWCFFGLLYSVSLVIFYQHGFVIPPSLWSWIYVLGVCTFGSLGHFLMNYAVRHAPAGLSSIVRSSGILWSYLLEVLVFRQLPQLWTILGVSLIVGSLAIVAVEKTNQKSPSSSDEEDDEIVSLQQLHSVEYGSIEDTAMETDQLLAEKREEDTRH
jgi:drug/metabolite transporter (DMT)-like permease